MCVCMFVSLYVCMFVSVYATDNVKVAYFASSHISGSVSSVVGSLHQFQYNFTDTSGLTSTCAFLAVAALEQVTVVLPVIVPAIIFSDRAMTTTGGLRRYSDSFLSLLKILNYK